MFVYLGKKVRCPRKLKKRLKKQYGFNYLFYFLGITAPHYSISDIRLADLIHDMCQRLYDFGPIIDF